MLLEIKVTVFIKLDFWIDAPIPNFFQLIKYRYRSYATHTDKVDLTH